MALGPVLDHKCLLRASFAVTRALRPGAYTSPSLARIDASEHSTHMHATTNWKRRWRSCRKTASIHVEGIFALIFFQASTNLRPLI